MLLFNGAATALIAESLWREIRKPQQALGKRHIPSRIGVISGIPNS